MSEATRPTFSAVIESFAPPVQEIATAARALIFDVLPEAVEVVWLTQRIIGYGTGPKKMSEHFCWIAPYRQHVALGFNYGSELPDPEGLLEGTGKLLRHVHLSTLDDVGRPGLRALVKAATTHRVPPPRPRASL